MDVFDILILIGLAVVSATLCFGLYALYRGGDFGRSYSNKLMRLRVLAQFITILIICAAFYFHRH
jgi:uncharacterized membrane protein